MIIQLLINQYNIKFNLKNKNRQILFLLTAMYDHDIIIKLLLATEKVNSETENTIYS